MTAALRSLLALTLVVGFYLLAVALTVGYAVFGAQMMRIMFDPETRWGWPMSPFYAVFGVLAALALTKVFVPDRHRPRPGTTPVDLDDAPELWETVMELADAVDAPIPTDIRVTLEPNAAVGEGPSQGGGRCLYVGLPLLAALRADELRAVLCHELGHYSHGHTRFAATVYQGAVALDRAQQSFARPEVGNPVVTVYTGFQHLTVSAYAWMYRALSFAVRRRQELEADAAAAAVAGGRATADALCAIGTVAGAWEDFRARYLTPMAEAGRLPDDPMAAFTAMFTDAGYRPVLDRRCRERPQERRRLFDSHPPLRERLQALQRCPSSPDHGDPRPAAALLGPSGTLPEGVLTALLSEVAPPDGEPSTVPWREWRARAEEWRTVRAVTDLDAALGLLARSRRTLGGVLDLVEAGRGEELAQALRDVRWGARQWGDLGEERSAVALRVLVGQSLVDAGRAGWRADWTGRPGVPVPADTDAVTALEAVAGAVEGPGRVARLRSALLRCEVALETPLASAGPAAGVPSRAAGPARPAEPAGRGRPAGPPRKLQVGAFLASVVTLLLFYGNYRISHLPPPDRTTPPVFTPTLEPRTPTCPSGYRPYQYVCLPLPSPSGQDAVSHRTIRVPPNVTLPELACRYGTNVPYLMALNFLDQPVLSPGQELIVPEVPATGAATATPCSANPWT
ncbi:M48 family metalloprotease [Streptomyces sp. NPDC057424]|uniref:M48 family metalloprotease n=1 Tax=Streptomyces sp. NPDC057424 TaxID=3346127 RepID=UPI00369D1848